MKRAYDRAHALCGQVGESPHLFPALHGLYRFELTRGEPKEAQALAERLLRLAQAQLDPLSLPAAHLALGARYSIWGSPRRPAPTWNRAFVPTINSRRR